MYNFVQETNDVRSSRYGVSLLLVFDFLVLAAYFLGHVHRTLCFFFPGECLSFPIETVFLMVLAIPHVLTTAIGVAVLLGTNASFVQALLSSYILAWLFDATALLVRIFFDFGETAGFRIFQYIVWSFWFLISSSQIVTVVVYSRAYNIWLQRAIKKFMKRVKSNHVANVIARTPIALERSRKVLLFLHRISVFLLLIFLFGSILFTIFPASYKLFTPAVFFFLVGIQSAQLVLWILYRGVASNESLLKEIEDSGLLPMSIPLARFVQVIAVMDFFFSIVSLVIRIIALVNAPDDVTAVGMAWAGALAGLVAIFIVVDITGIIFLGVFIANIDNFFRDMPFKQIPDDVDLSRPIALKELGSNPKYKYE